MPRSPRAGEVGGLYHSLNRGNLRTDIFEKEADVVAFGKICGWGFRFQIEPVDSR